MLWPSKNKTTTKTTINTKLPIPNRGGLRPAGSVAFELAVNKAASRPNLFLLGSDRKRGPNLESKLRQKMFLSHKEQVKGAVDIRETAQKRTVSKLAALT